MTNKELIFVPLSITKSSIYEKEVGASSRNGARIELYLFTTKTK